MSPLLIVPWIVFSISANTVAQLQLPLTILIASIGLAGTFSGRRKLVALTYGLLVLLLIWSKTVGDFLRVPGPDTALFLFEFMMILFFLEVSNTTLVFESNYRMVKDLDDLLSNNARHQIVRWRNNQFLSIGKMTVAALGLSLGLLLLGGLFSVSVNQLAFASILVVVSVIVLFFLLTHRREPRADNSFIHVRLL